MDGEPSQLQSDVNEASTGGKETMLRSFFNFPFLSDQVYQQGLTDLVARDVLRGRTDADKAEMIMQTQLFYFNRVTGQNLTAEDVRSYKDKGDSPETMNICQPWLNYEEPMSFGELKTLIEEGKISKIPNNKVIPDTVNEGPASSSNTAVRRKPWQV